MSRSRLLTRAGAGLAVGATALIALAAPASAHITIVTYGTTFTAGATNVFYFRVPHGCPEVDTVTFPNAAQTTKVEVNVPAAATGVKPEKKPGWDVAVVKDAAKNVTKITWTAHTNADALPDWTYGDFGVRATLNGNDGDKLLFPTTQYCGLHDDGTDASALALKEDWIGADTPTIVLVGKEKGVTNAAGLADLRVRITALETASADVKAKLDNAVALVTGLLGAHPWTGDADVTHDSKGRIVANLDLASIYKGQTASIVVNGVVIGSGRLNANGDLSLVVPAKIGATVPVGAVATAQIGDTVLATATVWR